jgi:hypothetical protein
MSAISSLASGLLHGVLPTSLVTNNTTASSLATITSPTIAQPTDIGQVSSLGQLLGTLQQLQQSNPAQYQQVTQQIATNLQSAAQTAQAGGNTAAANQLTQLSTDFTAASSSGQLPNLQDLARAVGGHHGHHHHASRAADSDSGSTAPTSTTAPAGSASQVLSQFLSAFQSSPAQNTSLNPASIIQNTLTSAGIGTVNA